ncbi:hypothetical protein ACEPPN_015389 [Leptodophora sp. 'Broadleaf-Isolate-01']
MQQSAPRGLGTGWQQDPVTLEDALGFRIPIPLDLVNSWDMLDMILLKRGDYRKRCEPREWVDHVPSPQSEDRYGMIFSDLDGNSSRCPRCLIKSEASSETRTQCTNTSCQMWFQRLVEIEESEPESIPRSTEMVSEEPAATPSSSRAKRPQVPAVTPADFQRVRLMSTLRKTAEREQIEEAYSGGTKDGAIVNLRSSRLSPRESQTTMSIDLLSPPLAMPTPPSNTLLITNLRDPEIVRADNLQTIKDLINTWVPIHSWAPLRTFQRIIVSFDDDDSEIRIRHILDGKPIMGQRVKVYFGNPWN